MIPIHAGDGLQVAIRQTQLRHDKRGGELCLRRMIRSGDRLAATDPRRFIPGDLFNRRICHPTGSFDRGPALSRLRIQNSKAHVRSLIYGGSENYTGDYAGEYAEE